MTTPSLADKVPSVASWGTSEQRKVDVREPEEHLTTMIDISAHLLCRDAGRFGQVADWPRLAGALGQPEACSGAGEACLAPVWPDLGGPRFRHGRALDVLGAAAVMLGELDAGAAEEPLRCRAVSAAEVRREYLNHRGSAS